MKAFEPLALPQFGKERLDDARARPCAPDTHTASDSLD